MQCAVAAEREDPLPRNPHSAASLHPAADAQPGRRRGRRDAVTTGRVADRRRPGGGGSPAPARPPGCGALVGNNRSGAGTVLVLPGTSEKHRRLFRPEDLGFTTRLRSTFRVDGEM